MALLAGRTLRVKTLADDCGGSHQIEVIEPDCSAENRTALIETERAWRRQARTQPAGSQRIRARLAVDTAFLASQAICETIPDHHVIVAQDGSDVRGISIFYYEADKQAWHLALHVRDPHDQGGSTARCQIRGVGSEMLGADADLMLSRLCATVELNPLDSGAARYWRGRGFVAKDGPCTEDTVCRLTCPGLQGLQRIYAHSPLDDEDQLADTLTGIYGRVDYSLHARLLAATIRPWPAQQSFSSPGSSLPGQSASR